MTDRPMPPHVTQVRDRHGRIRYRWRRTGVPGAYLPGEAWTAPWLARLAELEGQVPAPAPVASPARIVPRSVDDAARLLRESGRWQRHAASTSYTYGRALDRLLDITNARGVRLGARRMDEITLASLDRLMERWADKPGTATTMRKLLVRLFAVAERQQWIERNVAARTEPVARRGEGFRTWSDDEIAAYRARHPIGTTARLAMELTLATAARRCNVAVMERAHLAGDTITVAHAKGGHEVTVRLSAEALAALEGLPSAPIRWLVTTRAGRRYSIEGLGNAMRHWCDEAGLAGLSMHGLRKAQARRLAEAGATNAEGRAVTGHRTDRMFNHYAARANRITLAASAVAKLSNLPDGAIVQPSQKDAITDA